MIDFESFRNGVWGMTGRPDIPIAPYLTTALGAISRSGQYAEDLITVYYDVCKDAFTELPGPAYGKLAGWRIAGFDAAPPEGLSVRRVHSGTVEYHTDPDLWGNEPTTLLSATRAGELNRLMRECGGQPAISYAAGHAQVLVPETKWRGLKGGELHPVTVGITLLTSNESRGWNWADYESGGGATGSMGLNTPEYAEATPTPVMVADYIWQLESCLDLVTLGTAAGILRYAGQEREGMQMYQEFILGLRQYSRDRADELVDDQNALGF